MMSLCYKWGVILGTLNAEFSVIMGMFLLYGSWTVFGASIPITIEMDPVVQANGDLVLSISEMSLGLLNLPRDRILHYLNRQIATPDWLYFDSENEQDRKSTRLNPVTWPSRM